MIHDSHLRKLVEDSVNNFNEYFTHIFSPLDLICVDEYISGWYVQGGHRINLG